MPITNTQLAAPGDQNRCGFEDPSPAYNVADMYVRVGDFGDGIYVGGIVMALDVPQGATINSATMQLYNVNIGQGNKTYRIYADSALTQANFSGSDLPSDAAKTTAFGSITNPTNTDNTLWATINIATVIAEIVANGAWVQNNLIRFIIEAVTPAPYSSNDINAAGTYSDTSNEPSITVDYTAGGGGGSNPSRLLLLGVG